MQEIHSPFLGLLEERLEFSVWPPRTFVIRFRVYLKAQDVGLWVLDLGWRIAWDVRAVVFPA